MSKFFKTAFTTKEKLISAMLDETGWKSIDPKVVSLIKDKSGTPVGIYTTGTSNKGNPIMGYVYVSPEHRNKGYATKAALEFKKKHPNMEWRAAKTNKTSQHVANKLGLKVIGTENDEYIFKGASKEKKLYIMRGVPGAGKSTLAKKIQEKTPGAIIAANDDFYYEKGKYKWSPEKVKGANRLTRTRVEHALKSGKSVIADSLFITHKSYKPLLQLAKKHKATPIEVPVHFDPNKAKLYAKRNLHSVPEEAIKGMIKGFEHSTHPLLKTKKFSKLLKLIKVGEYAPGLPQKLIAGAATLICA